MACHCVCVWFGDKVLRWGMAAKEILVPRKLGRLLKAMILFIPSWNVNLSSGSSDLRQVVLHSRSQRIFLSSPFSASSNTDCSIRGIGKKLNHPSPSPFNQPQTETKDKLWNIINWVWWKPSDIHQIRQQRSVRAELGAIQFQLSSLRQWPWRWGRRQHMKEIKITKET